MMGDIPTPYLVGVDILVRDTRSEYYTQYLSSFLPCILWQNGGDLWKMRLLKQHWLFYHFSFYWDLHGLRSLDMILWSVILVIWWIIMTIIWWSLSISYDDRHIIQPKKGGLKVIKYDILVCHSCHMMIIILSYDDHHVIIWRSSSNRKDPTHAIFLKRRGLNNSLSVILVVRWSSN